MTALDSTARRAIPAWGTSPDIPVDRPALKCAGCGYALNGLPRCHACPECGLRYDLTTTVFSQRRTGNELRWVVWFLLTSAWACAAVNSGWGLTRMILAGMVLASLFAWNVLHFVLGRPGARHVAITPDGLIVRTRGREARLLAWSQIEEVRTSTVADRVFVHLVVLGERPLDLSACMETAGEAWMLKSALCESKLKGATRDLDTP